MTMSAKLARLEQQEAEFMAKYGKKSQAGSDSPVCGTPTQPASQSADLKVEKQEETAEHPQCKKNKKKKSTERIIELNGDAVSEIPETDVEPKKKKKKKKAGEDLVAAGDEVICVENVEADFSQNIKKKHKKKKKMSKEDGDVSPVAESEGPERTAELHTDTKVKKKKSSKAHSEHAEEEESHDTASSQSKPGQDCVPKTKKKKAVEVVEEENLVKQKRKKSEKYKPSVDDDVSEETLPPKKKKKKKSKE